MFRVMYRSRKSNQKSQKVAGEARLQCFLHCRVIGSCQSLQYTLNNSFPAFPSLRRCSCHVPNRNTHGRKIGGLWLSATVHVTRCDWHVLELLVCSLWFPLNRDPGCQIEACINLTERSNSGTNQALLLLSFC